jgi:two-component system LytT family response regulator
MIKAYLVDDERPAIERLSRMLQATGRVEILGSSTDPAEALAALSSIRPDVLFLDIRMPELSGFQLLAELANPPLVVFTTAYDEYALDAFRADTIDYLLKPIDIDELKDAVKRAAYVRKSGTRTHQIRNLIAHYKHPDEEPVLLVTIPESVEYVQMPDIVRCHACDDHTEIYMKDSRMLLIDMPVHEIEFLLQDYGFLRVHPAHIVNMKEVRKSARAESILIMYDGSEVPLSASRREAYRAKM